jgi:putative inorganic carbon (HCO3(-)) transporter
MLKTINKMEDLKVINWCDRIILGGLILLVFVLPFVFHTATLVTIGLLLPLIAWVVKIFLKKKKEFNLTPLFLPIILWGVVVFISSINSINPQYSLNEFRGEYLKQMLLFFLIVNNIKEKYEFKYIIYTLLFSCLFVAGFTIYGYFSGAALYSIRATGTYGSVTRQARYFLFLIPLTFTIFLNTNQKILKYFSFSILLISSFALILTLTRGIWISCGIVILILAFRSNWRRGVVVLTSILILVGAVPKVRERVIQTKNNFYQGINKFTSGRSGLIINSSTVIKDHPWIGAGYGLNIFNYLSEDYDLSDKPYLPPPTPIGRQESDAHDFYVQLMVETGVIGFIVFLYLLFTLYKFILKSFHELKENRDIIFTIILIISGFLFYGFVGYFYEGRNGLFFWLFVSLAISIIENQGKGEIIS